MHIHISQVRCSERLLPLESHASEVTINGVSFYANSSGCEFADENWGTATIKKPI